MKTIRVEAVSTGVETVTVFVDGELEMIDCPPKEQMQIDVSIDEIFCNIASYAYPDGKGEAELVFDYQEDSGTVSLTFKDSGVPFDPTAVEEPDIHQTADDRKIGGLGIFMVTKFMDEVHYEYKDGQNVLTVRKRIH